MNLSKLIEFLLLSMHYELAKEKKENYKNLSSLKYEDKDKMRKDFYKKKTVIQKLFFFEAKHHNYCKKCKNKDNKYYRIYCLLEFQLDIIKGEITINNLLDSLSQKKECEICNKQSFREEIKLNSCPLYLIIVIKNNNNNFKDYFKLTDKIDLKNYVTEENHDSSEYELVSFIKNPPIKEENKKGIIFCKSPVNNEWYKYKGIKIEK